jgi:CheY-like chemotaxis protein
MRPDILIIDDDQSIRRSIMRLLRTYSLECITVAGVEDAVAIDGLLQGFDDANAPILVDLSTIAIAFVDGQIPGSPEGWLIVPFLKAAGVFVVAMSGTNQADLLAAGADTQCDKLAFSTYLKGAFDDDYRVARERLAAR